MNSFYGALTMNLKFTLLCIDFDFELQFQFEFWCRRRSMRRRVIRSLK